MAAGRVTGGGIARRVAPRRGLGNARRSLDSGRRRARPTVPRAITVAANGDWRRLPETAILMQMRTTLNLDEDLLREALRLSGLKEKTAVLHAGLEALIARESAKRLAALGGTEKSPRSIRRRRSQRSR